MSKSTPVISIIVPVHNAAKYLPKCLDRLVGQTFKDIEIICIDDGSTDDSRKILQRYAKSDQRITVLQNKTPLGPGASRNRGLDAAKGEFIMFSDSDDYHELDSCESMHQAITSSGADFVCCATNIIYHAHRELKPSDDYYYGLKFSGRQTVNTPVILDTDCNVSSKILRKSLLDEYHLRFPEGLFFEDAYFLVAYYCISSSAYYLDRPLYNYIRHHHSVMSDTFEASREVDHAIDHLDIAKLLFSFLLEHALLEKYNQVYWALFRRYEDFALRNSKSSAARQRVVAEARAFLSEHSELLADANQNDIEELEHLNTGKFHVSSGRLKRLLLRFMPVFRREINNVLRARLIYAKNQQLLTSLNDDLERRLHER